MAAISRNDIDPANNVNFLQYSSTLPLFHPKFSKSTNWYDYIRVANTHESDPDPRGFLDLPSLVGVDRFQTYRQQTDTDRQMTISAINTTIRLPKLDEDNQIVLDKYNEIVYDQVLFRDIYKYPIYIRSAFLNYLNSVIGTGVYQDPKYRRMAEILTKQITGIDRPFVGSLGPIEEKKNQ